MQFEFEKIWCVRASWSDCTRLAKFRHTWQICKKPPASLASRNHQTHKASDTRHTRPQTAAKAPKKNIEASPLPTQKARCIREMASPIAGKSSDPRKRTPRGVCADSAGLAEFCIASAGLAECRIASAGLAECPYR